MALRKDIDWDGLRHFRALATHKSLTAAARALRVQHTTVARRLDALETSLGARLFLRNPRGWRMTRAGEALLESVEVIDGQIDRITALARGHDDALAGTVRVATADALATRLVVPAVGPLLRRNSGLVVEIVSDVRRHDLAGREADIALRLGTAGDDRLVGRTVGALAFGVYASAARAKSTDWRRGPYVVFDESVGRLPHDDWLTEHAPGAMIVLRANRQHTLARAVRDGVGFGVLPCLVGDAMRGVVRVRDPKDVFVRELWLVAHADVRRSPRVRLVMDAIRARVTARRSALLGLVSHTR